MSLKVKLQKIFDEQMKDPKVKAGMDQIKYYLKHLIYIEPKLYEVLISLNISLTKKDEKKLKEKGEEIFTVFTKLDHTTTKNLLSISVDKKVALAIKEITRNKPQRMFCEVKEAPFNVEYSTLTLNNMTVNISRNSLRFQLCEILLADQEDIGRVWDISEVLEIMSVDIGDTREQYNYLRNIVKPLNKRIEKQLGIPQFIDLNFTSITVNSIYVYTLFGK